ncbi:MAG TPA: DUF4328 domain-containing protein [Acidimicrobiales bacterium]|jgi:hypothetical protein|nr:DUF4328 domain-containing protein [Acidimicrobiales bacterium]
MPAPQITAASPYPAFDNEHSSAPWAKRALLVNMAVVVIGAGLVWLAEPSLHTYYAQARFRLEHPGTGTSFTQLRLPLWNRIITPVLALINVAAFVLFLVWQHRAASTARSLGYPARRSPALGVGGWFIPVCNFWFPYQAIRDCLPPGHPARPMVLHMWLWRVTVECIAVVSFILMYFGPTHVALAIRDVAAFATVIYTYLAFKLVTAIYTDHRRVLYPHEPTDPDGVAVVTGPMPG